jgi:hypothetical protein
MVEEASRKSLLVEVLNKIAYVGCFLPHILELVPCSLSHVGVLRSSIKVLKKLVESARGSMDCYPGKDTSSGVACSTTESVIDRQVVRIE